MNNTINRMKKRADTLAEFFIERYEELERENHKLLELHNQNYLRLRRHELAFEEALDKIIKIKKDNNNTIFITLNNGAYNLFTKDEPLYPLAEMLLGKYEKRNEFKELIKKGWIKPIKEE